MWDDENVIEALDDLFSLLNNYYFVVIMETMLLSLPLMIAIFVREE
jgi:hypothetical protein